MRPHLPRSTPVVVLVAVACLLLGSAGGAVAGSMITGKQIKNGTVTGVDIKNRSLSAKDLSKPTVKALRGQQGPRGLNAWDTIPSGKTVTGRFYEYDRAGATVTSVAENVNFPAKAPAAPTGYGFGPDSESFTVDDPACTGTYEAPTAPAGHVCVYLGGTQGIDNASVNPWAGAEQNPYTFYMTFSQTTADGIYEFWGNWAYTAP